MILSASRKLGKYEIRQKLGRGGMADVYLANDTALGYPVALKLIEHSADVDTRDAIEAERRGAELQARLAAIDPHVVRVFESGDIDNFFFVSMEYIEGQDLAELIRGTRLAEGFALDVAIAVARTLENAHSLEISIAGKNFHGIVHGDIKPKNIRIDARGEPRVLDFGIAKALSLSRRLTRNEFGSVPYASPERLDSGDVNAQSDLWSLAVMLYEMLTGMQPYQAANTEQLERMIRSRIPPPPAPDPCPEPLRSILRKALAAVPAVRYHSAHDFAADLISFRNGGPIQAVIENSDATRRTWRGREGADDETRRTAPAAEPDETRRTFGHSVAPGSGPSLDAPGAAPKSRRSAFGLFTRGVGVLALGCVLYGACAMTSWMRLHNRGQELERAIKSEQLTDPAEIWTKWTELSKSDPSSLALWSVRRLVKQKFTDAANLVISRYRNDTQLVREGDWQQAQTLLSQALAVDPDDNAIRGELRLCEGQLARINGIRHRDAQQLNVAIEDFNQAQQLLPKSPDPELGLATVYVYGLKDVEKADAALQQAQKRGYRLGNREKAQLADGYRERADRLFWDSRNVRGLPQEKDEIQRAASDYKRALDLYQSIVPYGNANAQIVRLQNSLDSVNTRLHEIGAS
jgi:predicted Ser/Thr protein kinase